jgi:hypothetical protein
MIAEIFEIIMIVCFGFSWPMNVIKSYKSRTTKGKSLWFLLLIITGYVFGIIGKLIKAFCDSPYMNKQNYSETLERLLEIFYYYKNETDEKLSDNELIDYMKTFFNGSCEGSLELLESRELDSLARALRRK